MESSIILGVILNCLLGFLAFQLRITFVSKPEFTKRQTKVLPLTVMLGFITFPLTLLWLLTR